MKVYVFVFLVCLVKTGFGQTDADIKKLNWLQGTWTAKDLKPGLSGEERWTKISDSLWQGSGVTLKGNDTAFVEKLKIVSKGNHLYYVADLSENKAPVYFIFTSITENMFECENAGHDFPKKIKYQKEGNKLKATISGSGKSIDYLFEKK